VIFNEEGSPRILLEGDAVKAMILAAGFGTRLLPLTREMAKAAIPFANRPLIHHCLGWLTENGVDEVVINLHHRPESIVSAVRQKTWPLDIHFSHEPDLLGTAGGVKKAERYFEKGTFVMVNSDTLSEIDLADTVVHHQEKAALATMVLRHRRPDDSYGTVRMDETGCIVSIRNRGVSSEGEKGYVFTGIHIFEPEVFQWIPRDRFSEINQEIYPQLIEDGQEVRGIVADAFWTEVGSHETYLKAHGEHLSRHNVDVVGESDLSDRVRLTPPILIGRGCQVGARARIGPSVVVGHGSRIGQRAVIEESVVWDDVTIGPDAHVKRSIVGHRTTIEPGTTLNRLVACGKERKKIE
jgi:mannose-1-phosphate guanylyltransferase